MKSKGIKFTGAKLGRPSKVKTEMERQAKKLLNRKAKERLKIEGLFGNVKRKYSLDLVKAKTKSTSESWIGILFLIMNIDRFCRAIFLSFLSKSKKYLERPKIFLKTLNISMKNEFSFLSKNIWNYSLNTF